MKREGGEKMKKFAILFIATVAVSFVSNAGVLAYWKFDESASGDYTGTYADSSGNGHILTNTVTQNPEGATGIDGNALYTLRDSSETNYRVSLQNTDAELTALSSFSISMFVDPYANNLPAQILSGDNWELNILDGNSDADGVEGYEFWGSQASETKTVKGGSIPYEQWDASGTVGDVVNNTVDWNHLAVTYDASTGDLSLYVDGAKTTVSFSSAGDLLAGSQVRINNFLGLIDDLQIYDEVLTDDQVGYLQNNPGSVVPEPASVSLILFSASLMVFLRRLRG